MKTLTRLLLASLLLCMLPLHAAPLQVAASFSILGDLVHEVGGDRVNVTLLVGPDQDAHVYQPTPSDIQKLTATQIFFINGLGFEGWQDRLLKSMRYGGKIITVSRGIQTLSIKHTGHEHGHGHRDPHIWQDPERVIQMVGTIRDALTSADPAGAAHYQQRADTFTKQIRELMQWAHSEIAKIPDNKRIILTSHDAFAYLGQRFGIRILSPQGVSTESEASARDVAKIIQQVRKSGIRALFLENISNPKMIEQIARETGAKNNRKLYSDALSRAPEAATYLQMYRYNVSTLMAGMQNN